MPNAIRRLPQVKIKVGLSRSSIYSAIAEKRFPQPVRLGPRARFSFRRVFAERGLRSGWLSFLAIRFSAKHANTELAL